MTSMNLDFTRLYKAKERLYSRLLPRYFPALTGQDVQTLLALYDQTSPAIDVQKLTQMHRAAGVALSRVDVHLGLHAEDAKHWVTYLMNLLRDRLAREGLVQADQLEACTQAFYAQLQASGQATPAA